MSAISWPLTVPSPSSDASSGDDAFRSLVTSFALGVSSSFVWPGSGGGSAASAGESVLGNARFAYSNNTTAASAADDGFLLLNTDFISVHHTGSTATSVLGHSAMLTHSGVSGAGPSFAAPYDAHWVVQEGTVVPSTRTSVVTFPTSFSPRSGMPVPIVLLSLSRGGNITCLQEGSVTSVGFTAVQFGAEAPTAFSWRAEGQVTL